MRKSLFLYLFIIAVLMNIFTYKYFTSKENSEQNSLTEANGSGSNSKVLSDSIAHLNEKLSDATTFSLENNDRAQNYLVESKINDIPAFSEKVKQVLLAFNDDPNGNKYTDQPKMGEQKFTINTVKILNHRWIIANYNNGQLWGEVLLKYFVDEKGAITFNIIDSYLYPAVLN